MKSLKQSALVLAIAGLPLSGYAELKPLHDADMGQITGQAGVTIELETQVTMDEFTYTDEGTLGISDIFIGGADRIDMFEEFTSGRDAIFGTSSTDLIDNIKIELDVADDGDAIINVFPITARPVDFAVRTRRLGAAGQRRREHVVGGQLLCGGSYTPGPGNRGYRHGHPQPDHPVRHR